VELAAASESVAALERVALERVAPAARGEPAVVQA